MKIKHALGIGLAGCLALASLPAFGVGGKKEVTPADAGITAPADVTPTIDPRSGGVTDWVPPESEFFEPVDLDEAIAEAQEIDISDRSADQSHDPAVNSRELIASAFLQKAKEEPGPTFAGVLNRGEEGIAETWWKGKAPAYVYDLVPKAKEAGIEFIIHEDAKFNRIEISNAITRLLKDPLSDQLGIVAAGTGHDGSGINLSFEKNAPNPFPTEQLRRVAGIDCDFTYDENGGKPVLTTARSNDSAPFSGGARINFSYSGRDVVSCTSGFPVLKGGVGYLTTGDHCDPTNKKAVTNGVGTLIARSSHSGSAAIDTKLIDPIASPATGPYIYTGPSWNSSKKSRITSVGTNNKKDYVCLGGATSGKRCGIIADDRVQLKELGLSGDWYIEVVGLPGWSNASGDSGGPWYKDNDNGTVQARGGQIAGRYPVRCSGLAPDVTAQCYSRAYYVPATVIQNSLNVKIER